MTCSACPFSHSAEAEQVINYGCVPDGSEIMRLKRDTGKNWGCHEAVPGETRLCAGFVQACTEQGVEYRGAPILAYADWYRPSPALEASTLQSKGG